MELSRVPAGRVSGVFAQPGTILGPKEVTREFVVVTSADSSGPSVEVGYATEEDLSLPADRNPRSVTEFRMMQLRQTPQREALKVLFQGTELS